MRFTNAQKRDREMALARDIKARNAAHRSLGLACKDYTHIVIRARMYHRDHLAALRG